MQQSAKLWMCVQVLFGCLFALVAKSSSYCVVYCNIYIETQNKWFSRLIIEFKTCAWIRLLDITNICWVLFASIVDGGDVGVKLNCFKAAVESNVRYTSQIECTPNVNIIRLHAAASTQQYSVTFSMTSVCVCVTPNTFSFFPTNTKVFQIEMGIEQAQQQQ